jgi:aminomethyltransferase
MLDVRHPNLWRECAGVPVAHAGLHWLVDFQKDDYVGRDAIVAGVERPKVGRVGFVALASGEIAPGVGVRTADEVVGQVVWSTYSPGRGAVIGIAELPIDICVPSLRLAIGENGAGGVTIETLSSPLVVPGSWAVVAAERAAELGGEAGEDG